MQRLCGVSFAKYPSTAFLGGEAPAPLLGFLTFLRRFASGRLLFFYLRCLYWLGARYRGCV